MLPNLRYPAGPRLLAFLATLLAALLTTPAHACPHCGGDSAKIAEHAALLALVPVASATHTAATSGNWSASSTWGGAGAPSAGSRVVIPAGLTVTYDVNSSAAIQWLLVEGTLRFRTDITTALSIDTIVVLDTGAWEQGTVTQPVAASVTSTITFTDIHAIDDPSRMERGLISKGRVRIHGSVVTPYVQATGALASGATAASLTAAPVGWKSGDQLVVAAMRLNSSFQPQDEVRTLASISGTSLTWSGGLGHARVVEFPQFGLTPFIANHTRNVRFTSAVTSTNPADFPRRGHVMLMHNPDVDVRYASFHHLGRTRKDVDVTNAWNDPTNPGSNPRGRYALHLHRTGKDDFAASQAYIAGCSVVNPSSWAFVSHDSIAHFEDNVAHDSFGAAFITENGGEGGSFRGNLSTTVRGRGFIKDGTANHDLARSGIGFWFQGGNVAVEENIAISSTGAGFSLFQRTGVDLGANKRIYRQNLLDFEAAGGLDYIDAPDTPMFRFYGNVSIGNYHGIFNVDNEINGLWPTASILDAHVDLNSGGMHGIRIEYYRNFLFRDSYTLRDASYPANVWHGTYAYNANHLVDHLYPWPTRALDRWQNVTIRGFINGIDNDDGDLGVSAGSPERIAKHEVIDNSIDFVSTGGGHLFANTGTLLGEALVRNSTAGQVMQFPSFFPIAGIHGGAVTVTISKPPNAPSGAKLYYVTGPVGYVSPSVESKLRSGQWTLYTGPVTISSSSKLIAVCVDDSVSPHRISRIRNGVYTINASAPQAAAPSLSPNGGNVSSSTPVVLQSSTGGTAVRYTTDGSDPRTSATGRSIPSGGAITLAASATVRAFAYRDGHRDSSVSQASFTVGGTVSPPAAPTGLSATAGNGQVALGWAATSGATSYTVKRGTSSGGPFTNVASGLTSTSYTNTGLTNGTTYWFVVSASNAGGQSADSAAVSATPAAPPSPPATPSGLSASAGNTQVTLAWSASAAATSYAVKRATASGGPYTTVASGLTTTGTTVTGLTNGTTYWFTVNASNAAGTSGDSSAVSATPTASGTGLPAGWTGTDIGSPSLTGTSNHTSGTFTVQGAGSDIWGSSDQFRYVYQSLAGDGTIVARVASLGNTDVWAKAGVMIRSSLGADSTHAFACVTPGNGTRLQRRTSTGGASADSSVVSGGAPRWLRLQRSGGTVTMAHSTDGSSWTTLGTTVALPTGAATIGLAVTSHNSGSLTTAVFDSVTITGGSGGTPPPTPTGLSTTAGNASVSLSWNAASGATSYTVERATASGGPFSTVASGLGSTSHTETGLTNGTTYWFRISAANASGTSSPSSAVSATPVAPAAPVTLTPTDDRDTQSDNAAGTNPTLNFSQWNHAYFRFNLASAPSSASNARLRLYLPAGAGSGITATAYKASNDNWTQSGSAPGYGGAAIGSVTLPTSPGWVEITITAAVQAELAGDDLISVAVVTSSGGWTGLQSREGANPPQLVVTP